MNNFKAGKNRDIVSLEPIDIHETSQLVQIHWSPGIGDPTFVGWLTVVMYFVAFLFCVACAKRSGIKPSTGNSNAQSTFWWCIALALLLLGINKQLDFQTLITEAGRMFATRQGWYEHRKSVQVVFIAGIICCSLYVFIMTWMAHPKIWEENWLTLVGLIFLVSFIFIRAISFHKIDMFLGLKLSEFKMNWLLELGGIVCIWMSAAIKLKWTAKKALPVEIKHPVRFL